MRGAAGHNRALLGDNFFGQVGDGTKTEGLVPVVVKNGAGTGPLTNVAQLAVGTSHVCALLRDGTVRCWGEGGASGDANTSPTPANQLLPGAVMDSTGSQPIRNVAQIGTAIGQTCVRESDHTAQCFGENGEGELGDENHAAFPGAGRLAREAA